ncbi:MAG TPA: hypothetical protein VE992_02320 [Solirubrobacteraceae bacterium]|nr:hypothetical protein [Solirubrobacteraceae bacterium]
MTVARRPAPAIAWRPGLVVGLLCLGVAAASLAVQNAASYDPWGWIVWGREVLHLKLSTTEGPSWKPGAVIFTTVFALFGGAAPSLWMVTARAGALAAVAGAFRLGDRLGGRVAGSVAAVLLLTMHDFVMGAVYGNAEPLMAGFLLFGIDSALSGRRRTALSLLLFAALLRPEVWPLLGAYSLYLFVTSPRDRVWVIASWLALGALWFGGDWLGSGNPLLSSKRAKQFVIFNAFQHHPHPGLAMLKLAGTMLHWEAAIPAVLAVVVAARRRRPEPLLLAGAALAMLVTVTAMAQDGYPVLDRFLFGSVALAFVLAGLGAGWVIGLVAARSRALAVVAALAVAALLTPMVVSGIRSWRPGIAHARQVAAEISGLRKAIAGAGGARAVVACRGSISTYVTLTSAMAWYLRAPMTRITGYHRLYGLVFVHGTDPLHRVVSGRPLHVRPVAQAADWRVLYVDRSPGAPTGC